MAAKEWKEQEIRDLISVEVTTGTTMRILNECIANGSMTESIKAIAEAANAHVVSLTAQAATNAQQTATNLSEIVRVFTDCRTFVEQTCIENEASKHKLSQEFDALQIRFRDVVQFVDGVPTKVSELHAKLDAVTDWCAKNSLETVPVAVLLLQEKVNEIQAHASQRFGELSTEISVTRSAVGSGTGFGGQGSA